MAIHLQEFDIYQFRGIHNLELKDLNHINIITGDNNTGKTSVLENGTMSRKRTPKIDKF